RVHRTRTGVRVLVAVEDQRGVVVVEQLPPGVGHAALLTARARSRGRNGGGRGGGRAEGRLVPVRHRARRVVVLRVVGQPLRLLREQATVRGRAVVVERGRVALDVQRDDVPVAEVVRVPALGVRGVVTSLALRVRRAALVVAIEVGEVAGAVLGGLVVALL